MSVLRIVERPSLRRPILLAAFGGWGDAGSSATGALAYLLGDPPPAACARVGIEPGGAHRRVDPGQAQVPDRVDAADAARAAIQPEGSSGNA